MHIGLRRLLLLAGLGVGVTSTLWCLAGSVKALFGVELFTGCAWAAWEYATFQLLLESSSSDHRLRFLSIAGTLTAAAQLAGALAGTLLLEQAGLTYREVFLTSSALRLASLAVLLLELRHVPHGARRLVVLGDRPRAFETRGWCAVATAEGRQRSPAAPFRPLGSIERRMNPLNSGRTLLARASSAGRCRLWIAIGCTSSGVPCEL